MPTIELRDRREARSRYVYKVDIDSTPLGSGGMGTVFRGQQVDVSTGYTQDVAVKFLNSSLSQDVIERARRESDIRLKTDNLIEMIDFVETDENTPEGKTRHYHVVSELLHGVSLLDFLRGKTTDGAGNEIPFAAKLYKRYKKDKTGFAIYMVKNILQGLFVLHSNGYVHRDIDPSNVMINDDGRIKIIDFGIAKNLHNEANAYNMEGVAIGTVMGTVMGKAAYSAPELVAGDVSNHNYTSDIYSVGIILYVILTGTLPFKGTPTEIHAKVLNAPVPIGKISDRKLGRIIKKATNKKQSKRYSTAAEFITDLDTYSKKPEDYSWGIILAVTAFAAICGILLGFLL